MFYEQEQPCYVFTIDFITSISKVIVKICAASSLNLPDILVIKHLHGY